MKQVKDDPALLNEMMDDSRRSLVLYRPTNYWSSYEKIFMPELRRKGLKDFRRRRGSILSTFGATDHLIGSRIETSLRIRGAGRAMRILNSFFAKLPFLTMGVTEINPSWVTPYFFWYVREKFDRMGLDLGKCSTSTFGNPEDLVELQNGLWSRNHLQYCSLFADAARHIRFRPDSVVCELGGGMGRNIEVIAKLFESATLLLFDIPPQLYVANQYLSSVFGPRVIGYREARSLLPKDFISLDPVRGKIVILPNWRMPDWSTVKVDVFWNSASFQEMEPDVVVNYLNLVIMMQPEWIYINAMPGGNYWGEWKPGRGGTKEPVVEGIYADTLKNHYTLHVSYDTDGFLRAKDYTSYIFKKTVPGLPEGS